LLFDLVFLFLRFIHKILSIRIVCLTSNFSVKKAIVLSFLLLANTIILAHVAISHHHHDGIFVTCADDQHKHDCNSHNHHHDDTQPAGHCNDPYCHGNIEDCSLANLYVRVDNDNRVIPSFVCDFNLLPFFLTLFSEYFTPQIADGIGLPFRQNPFLQSVYTEFIVRSTGLRAPPFELF